MKYHPGDDRALTQVETDLERAQAYVSAGIRIYLALGMSGHDAAEMARYIVEREANTWTAESNARDALDAIERELSARLEQLDADDETRRQVEAEAAHIQLFRPPPTSRETAATPPQVDPGYSGPAALVTATQTAAESRREAS